MLRVKVSGVKNVVLEDVEECNIIKDNEALIEVAAVGLCGSDMHVYLGENPVLKPPIIQGHEFGGVIKVINDNKYGLKTGDKVAVNPLVSCGKCYYCLKGDAYLCEKGCVIGGEIDGALAERIVVPIPNLVKLDDSFDLLYSPLIEPTAVAVHTADHIRAGNVVVIGQGPIGNLCSQVCKVNGNRVISIDINDYTLDISKQVGSDLVLNSMKDNLIERIDGFLGDEKVDAVVDTVCNKSTMNFAIKVLKKRGELVLVGIPVKSFDFNLVDLLCKEIRIITSYLYSMADFLKAHEYVSSGKVKIQPLLTKVFDLTEAPQAYEYKHNTPSLKVVIKNGRN